MYITYSEYTALYDTIEEKVFIRLAYDACCHIDRQTTGVDGVKKLKVAFPADEDSAAAIKHCAANLVYILYQINEAEQSASAGRGYVQAENGMHGKVIASVSAGNESVSYSAGSSAKTTIDSAVSDMTARNDLIRNTVREYLSGISDANGVNLLYMGAYPRRYLC